MLKLREEGLMDEKLLVRLSNDGFKRISHSISVGQLEILREHRKDIRKHCAGVIKRQPGLGCMRPRFC